MDTIKVKINGIEVCAPKGSTILEAARLAHIEIPTLCFLKEINEIEESEETRLYAESLRQLVDNAAINIPVTLEKYYPGRGFETDKPQIEIKLHLIKHGGLKLDI